MGEVAAAELDWQASVTENLQPNEWPDDVLEHMTAGVILELSDLREQVGAPVWPSPVLGAHVRHRTRRAGDGDRHATDNGSRLSDATDFFLRWADAPAYLRHAMRSERIGGIGIYDSMMLDGEPGDHCMMHIDTRPERVMWVGNGREPVEYVLEHSQPKRFYQLISAMLRSNT